MAAAALLISVSARSGLGQEPAMPAKAALAHLEAYLEAFNSGSLDRMKAFFGEHFTGSSLKEATVAQRLARYQGGKRQFKSFSVERIVATIAFQASILTTTGTGQNVLLRATVEKAPPYKLVSITAELVEDPESIVVPEPKADEQEFTAAVRAFLEAQTKADEFSGVVLVAKDSRTILHEACGFADRDKRVPNRKDTKFNLGSINKNFTRVAIHQLVREGRLSLDDPIKKFLRDYPNAQAAEKVTVRMLLSMTSGIGDFFGDRFDATPKEKIRTLQDYLALFADKPLEFEPGTSNRYSNGGYIVLGLILEKASGVDYYTYVRENIFKPCGMADTDSFPRDADTPNLARGYTREGGSEGNARILNFATLPGRGSSAGGGYSTAGDLLKYVLALKEKKIYLPDIAGGLGIAGGAPGINSVLEWDARSGYTVIVMTNFDPPTAGHTARQVVGWLPQ
jgi:D-alanyl-D-alanine carboxypeptidase